MDANCTKCGLHRFRRQVVSGRGSVPAQVLFIGEAPGKSEDLRGQAFVGLAGRLLNQALEDAGPTPTYYIDNVCACRPCNFQGGPNRTPTGEEAWACWPRLERTYARVTPRRVVFLGEVAWKYCQDAWPDGVKITHPAAVLRRGGRGSTAYRQFVKSIKEVFRGLQT